MPSANITIPLPVLVAGQSFKVRYRELPAGAWGGYSVQDNDEFTITGLDAGNYELEVIVVEPDESECPPTYKLFTINEVYTCIDFVASMSTQNNSVFYLHVTFTPPATEPPCGWTVIYTQNGNLTTIQYPTGLPSNGILNITVPFNVVTHLTIQANLCNGNVKNCHDADVSPVATPCTPAVIQIRELKYNPPNSSIPDTYFIRLTILNSTPTTQTYIINFQETSYTGAFPPDSGSYTYNGASLASGTPFLYSFQVHPNSLFKNNVNGGEVFYQGSLVDGCGVSHPFTVQLP